MYGKISIANTSNKQCEQLYLWTQEDFSYTSLTTKDKENFDLEDAASKLPFII